MLQRCDWGHRELSAISCQLSAVGSYWFSNFFRSRRAVSFGLLLVHISFGDADGEGADAGDHAYALGDADGSAGVENVEQVRTLQAEVEGAEDRKAAAVFAGRSWLFAIRLSVIASL